MKVATYYDLANDNYAYLFDSVQNGFHYNSMGALAQECCENFLKYVIVAFTSVEGQDDACERELLLCAHNMAELIEYLENKGIAVNDEVFTATKRIEGFISTTRYPGPDSIVLSKADISNCIDAVKKCRAFAENVIVRAAIKRINSIYDRRMILRTRRIKATAQNIYKAFCDTYPELIEELKVRLTEENEAAFQILVEE